MKKSFILFLAVILLTGHSYSQPLNPITWTYDTEIVGDDEIDLIFKAFIDKGWHMYGLNMPEGGPYPVSFNYSDTAGFEISGKPVAVIKPLVKFDEILGMKLETLEGEGLFKHRIRRLTGKILTVSGYVEYMACNDKACTPPLEQEFTIIIEEKPAGSDKQSGDMKTKENPAVNVTFSDSSTASATFIMDSAQTEYTEKDSSATVIHSAGDTGKKSLWVTILLSMLAGLGALLTPCVYPMIPLTVSFFIRDKKSKAQGITEAFVFGLSITFIYTLLGVLVAIFKDPNAVNTVSIHWLPNLIFFIVFVLLAASFFGMFEIMLPGSITGKIDRQADRGGIIGAFFMALGMTILSFSCTGPIVASLLIKASEGEVLEPVIGMFGFGVVFAVPFTLFAIFPSWLKGLPKSGSWLNSVKVFMAFIMLAFSLYFLNKIDQVYHLNLLTRELYIGFWIVVFTLLGFYLLGKIRFPHDSKQEHISVPRFLLVVIVFTFVLYLVPGLFGSDLKGIAPLLPAKENQEFDLTGPTGNVEYEKSVALCGTPRYSDFLSLPHGLQGYFDYSEAIACAYEKNKPVLLDFVGHTCANCKKMYENVWSDPEVLEMLRSDFIIAALHTDDKTKLPEDEWYTSEVDNKVKNTIGRQNVDFQISKFNSNALPLYAIVNAQGKILTKEPFYVYNPGIQSFLTFLEEGLDNYKSEWSSQPVHIHPEKE
ncbi:MAG: thioredoxin family protein [Bacteroidales bacterium]|nr:thioredoxin family protein [Bacteroidales bacterium]